MKMRDKFLIILTISLSILLLVINVYALSDDGQKINLLSKDEAGEIEKIIEENMAEGHIPGLSITIVKNDEIVYQRGFGYSDIDKEKPITSQSLFELASNSKAFTALGILSLEENGQINLTDEVAKHIPWLKVKYKGKEFPITIEQILHQTSGIPAGTIDKIPISNEDSALKETVKTLIGIELDSEPGETFQYATINYDVLGLIIEKVTGSTYEKYMEENILKPMELNNTYLFRSEDINDRIVSGYKIGFQKPQLYEAPIYRGNKPAGYIISSGEDMAKWMKIQMGTMNELNFNKEVIKKSHKANSVFDSRGNEVLYAGGWFLQPQGNLYHLGMNPNYSSFIICSGKGSSKGKIGVAVLCNLNSNYVQNIGLGINGVLHGESFREYIKDSNQFFDKVALGTLLIAIILIVSFLFFIIKCVIQINRKQRHFQFNGIKSSLKITFYFLLMLGLSYFIYLIPRILFGGVSWGFSFVWSPNSVKVALYSLYTAIWIMYLYFMLISYFKKNDTLF